MIKTKLFHFFSKKFGITIFSPYLCSVKLKKVLEERDLIVYILE